MRFDQAARTVALALTLVACSKEGETYRGPADVVPAKLPEVPPRASPRSIEASAALIRDTFSIPADFTIQVADSAEGPFDIAGTLSFALWDGIHELPFTAYCLEKRINIGTTTVAPPEQDQEGFALAPVVAEACNSARAACLADSMLIFKEWSEQNVDGSWKHSDEVHQKAPERFATYAGISPQWRFSVGSGAAPGEPFERVDALLKFEEGVRGTVHAAVGSREVDLPFFQSLSSDLSTLCGKPSRDGRVGSRIATLAEALGVALRDAASLHLQCATPQWKDDNTIFVPLYGQLGDRDYSALCIVAELNLATLELDRPMKEVPLADFVSFLRMTVDPIVLLQGESFFVDAVGQNLRVRASNRGWDRTEVRPEYEIDMSVYLRGDPTSGTPGVVEVNTASVGTETLRPVFRRVRELVRDRRPAAYGLAFTGESLAVLRMDGCNDAPASVEFMLIRPSATGPWNAERLELPRDRVERGEAVTFEALGQRVRYTPHSRELYLNERYVLPFLTAKHTR